MWCISHIEQQQAKHKKLITIWQKAIKAQRI
jgi:hypothetical protein